MSSHGTATMSHHGRIWWNELNTWNPDKAKAYYSAVLGWEYDEAPTADGYMARPYYIAKKDGVRVAGIFTLYEPVFKGAPEHWFTYLAVDDVTKAVAESNACGGSLLRDPFDIPGFGTLAVVRDCNGAVMGLFQPA